jgi:hypothetical protein
MALQRFLRQLSSEEFSAIAQRADVELAHKRLKSGRALGKDYISDEPERLWESLLKHHPDLAQQSKEWKTRTQARDSIIQAIRKDHSMKHLGEACRYKSDFDPIVNVAYKPKHNAPYATPVVYRSGLTVVRYRDPKTGRFISKAQSESIGVQEERI